MQKIKIGLLPFYLELYDRIAPRERRRPLELFYDRVTASLRRRGVDVVTAPICRLQPEFKRAVHAMEQAGAEVLVTLHLAYSPSLESAAVLAAAELPVVILDTTPEWDFGPGQAPSAIMANHGIHGVQDMCNLLLRNGKPFMIEAGHWRKSDVLDRIVMRAASAAMASRMRRARVGRVGRPFKGMGDFQVSEKVLRYEIGLRVIQSRPEEFRKLARTIKSADVDCEMRMHRKIFRIAAGAEAAHRRSIQAGLIVRRWLEQEKLTGYSINFQAVGRPSGLAVMPFLEAGLAMKRGVGYAGEGDVLTAGLMGAIAAVFPETTFTEMFCPDWKGGRIFLSHMGEWNIALAAHKPRLLEYNFIFGRAANPVRPAGCLRGGRAVFVNLAPLPENRFRLILAPGCMQAPKSRDRLADTVHGWFKPHRALNDFLAAYSRAGGTHHSVLVYGDHLKPLTGFGELMGWEVVAL